jgi:hypothetical protein
MKKILTTTLAMVFLIVIFSQSSTYGEGNYFSYNRMKIRFLAPMNGSISSYNGDNFNQYYQYSEVVVVPFSFEDKDIGYEETQLRRFEIIFFISLPVTFILSLAGLGAFKLASGSSEGFRSIDYQYIALSSVALSFAVALHDNRVVFKKGGI